MQSPKELPFAETAARRKRKAPLSALVPRCPTAGDTFFAFFYLPGLLSLLLGFSLSLNVFQQFHGENQAKGKKTHLFSTSTKKKKLSLSSKQSPPSPPPPPTASAPTSTPRPPASPATPPAPRSRAGSPRSRSASLGRAPRAAPRSARPSAKTARARRASRF